jgi:hypothetical protein
MAQRAERHYKPLTYQQVMVASCFEQQKATVQIKTLRLRSATGKNNPGSE